MKVQNKQMIKNINTKEYWDNRFISGDWNKNGQKQSKEYAKANLKNIEIDSNFAGTILDFGCAEGDAIPQYFKAFPKAKIFGIDISETAISKCKNRFGSIANFQVGDNTIIKFKDIIIASHIMEHITNDISIIKDLLLKCNDLFVFVPYKENPLYYEHVNYYNEEYYKDLNVFSIKIFTVCYQTKLPLKSIVKGILLMKFRFWDLFRKDIIMFHFKGTDVRY